MAFGREDAAVCARPAAERTQEEAGTPGAIAVRSEFSSVTRVVYVLAEEHPFRLPPLEEPFHKDAVGRAIGCVGEVGFMQGGAAVQHLDGPIRVAVVVGKVCQRVELILAPEPVLQRFLC